MEMPEEKEKGTEEIFETMCMLSCFSHILFLVTPCTVASQAPLSMGILQAGILERVAMPSCRGSSQPRDLPNPQIKPKSLTSPALASGFLTTSATWRDHLKQ